MIFGFIALGVCFVVCFVILLSPQYRKWKRVKDCVHNWELIDKQEVEPRKFASFEASWITESMAQSLFRSSITSTFKCGKCGKLKVVRTD